MMMIRLKAVVFVSDPEIAYISLFFFGFHHESNELHLLRLCSFAWKFKMIGSLCREQRTIKGHQDLIANVSLMKELNIEHIAI